MLLRVASTWFPLWRRWNRVSCTSLEHFSVWGPWLIHSCSLKTGPGNTTVIFVTTKQRCGETHRQTSLQCGHRTVGVGYGQGKGGWGPRTAKCPETSGNTKSCWGSSLKRTEKETWPGPPVRRNKLGSFSIIHKLLFHSFCQRGCGIVPKGHFGGV